MFTIAYLADHLHTIPTLAEWFRAQWPDYFAQKTQAELEADFRAQAVRQGIPLRLVAFDSGELAGTIVLRERAMESLAEFQPGLGGLFVPASHRGRGIGTELIRAGMEVARQAGYGTLYIATHTAAGIVARLGWEQVTTVLDQGEWIGVYYYKFVII